MFIYIYFLFYIFRWVHDYQDACVDKVEKFLTGEKSPIQKTHPPLPAAVNFNALERMSPRNSLERMDIQRNSVERLLGATNNGNFSN